MTTAVKEAEDRLLLSGNEAVARAAWEAGVKVATSYPGTPATEILEAIALYPNLHAQFSVNEKVAMEVAIGAAMSGVRALCSMKHVGMNVAADAFMTYTLTGTKGGLVIVVADDVGLSSSQNEQDSRYWGRFGHMPMLEPADSQEAYEMTKAAFEISERFATPVILRATTRVCHVKAVAVVGERVEGPKAEFVPEAARWVMVPGNARNRLPLMAARDVALKAFTEETGLNRIDEGSDRRVGFVTSGPVATTLREVFPDAPIFKLGFSCPLPIERLRAFAATVDTLVVAEETEPLIEMEMKAAGIAVRGKEILPRFGELLPHVVGPAVRPLLGIAEPPAPAAPAKLFPRPPTLCPACPHLAVYHTLARLRKKVVIAGDIGCYSLGAGHPWGALDTCVSMGASMGVALGMDKARDEDDRDKAVLAVIGDSTFLHMGMQGLLDITYTGGNVTVLLMDNGTTGMTGGQNHPANGRDLKGAPAPKVDFARLVTALGVAPERVHVVDPYQLPVLDRTLRQEIATPGPSVIITNRPCTLIEAFERHQPYHTDEDACTGCGKCIDIGCPAISVARRETAVRKNGREVELAFARIDTAVCTGCGMCVNVCASEAIVRDETAAKEDCRP
ncbi:thiamine pyrophosphate-dependent enzyme [Oleispirillum naphthae]|uniref:thiamine pyrophosphate-dependent enzyme n=1 Tax=Oleispirillum naphthae TaxID=2838853 RepID=UPI0030822AA4